MTIEEIKKLAPKDIRASSDSKTLKQARIKYLGRKGKLTQVLRSLKDLPVEKRREIGPQAQQLKKKLEEKIDKKQKKLSAPWR